MPISNTRNSRVKKFFSYYKSYMGLFAVDMGSAVAATVVSLTFPLLVRYVTKDLLEGGQLSAPGQILQVGAVMLALILANMLFTYLYDTVGHGMGAKMESDMRADLFAHYQRLSFRFHDDNKPGHLMSRLTNSLLSLTELYHHGPEDLVIYLVKFIGAFAILCSINLNLSLAVLAIVPFMVIYTLIFSGRLRKIYRANFDRIADINAHVEENLSGIRVVASFTAEELEKQKFDVENKRFLASRNRIYRNESYLYVGIDAMGSIITVIVITMGGLLLLNNSLALSMSDLITFLMYIAYLVAPIPALVNATRLYQEGIAGFNSFMELMETNPDITDAENATDIGAVQGDISFRDVSFQYREENEYVLKNINLEVKAGEHVALVGASGVGKTTLCSLIPRFYEVTGGKLLLDGRDIRGITLKSLRDNIGVVQQDVYLFAGTVEENIRYGRPGATMEDIVEAAKMAGAHDFIAALPDGYGTDIGHRGVRLSGGQKQRIGIARVFLKNPPILILDEATSALDTESERIVRESLDKLAEGRTTLVIAHRLSTIQDADRILVLTEQGIGEQGTHEELLQRGGAYAALHQRDQRDAGPNTRLGRQGI